MTTTIVLTLLGLGLVSFLLLWAVSGGGRKKKPQPLQGNAARASSPTTRASSTPTRASGYTPSLTPPTNHHDDGYSNGLVTGYLLSGGGHSHHDTPSTPAPSYDPPAAPSSSYDPGPADTSYSGSGGDFGGSSDCGGGGGDCGGGSCGGDF